MNRFPWSSGAPVRRRGVRQVLQRGAQWILTVAGTLVLSAAAAAQAADPRILLELREKTRSQLETIARELDGVMGYVALDIESGERLEHLPEEPFPLASTIKLAILYELFRQADEGKLSLDELRPLDRQHVVAGSGILVHLTTPSLSLRDYAVLMIVLSDNTATNLLIDTVGMEQVTRRMRALGLPTVQLRRRMIDMEAARRGDENVGSPADVARLLVLLYRGEGLEKASAEALIGILRIPKRSALRDGVPATVRVANKTGTLEGVAADAGIVYLAGRPYVLVVTTTYLKDNAVGEAAIRAASRTVFDYFNRLERSSDYGRVIR